MAVSRDGRRFTTCLSYVCCIAVIFFANCRRVAEATCMWTAPPPAWNQTNPGTDNIQTTVIRVLNGTANYPVRWNYTLLGGQSITFAFFAVGDGISQPDTIGYVLSGRSTINDRHDYQTRFSIESTSEFSTLTIKKVTEKERATFQCRLQLGSNTWAYNIRVEITVAPVITEISGNQTVNEADIVTLNCTADGNPAPNITWTRLSDNSVVTFPLTITGIQDEGAYRCTANNGFGDLATADVFIAVQIPPNITDISDNQTVIQNDHVTLNCTADGNPAPNITWTRLSDNSVVTFPLTITGMQDEGGYRCTANNGFGDLATADVFIAVRIPPDITDISDNQTVNQSDHVILNCTVDGNPAPNITWTRLSDNCVVTFPLTITGKQDEGAYRCTADNGCGNLATVDVFIAVENYQPINTKLTTNVSADNTVVMNTIFNLTCSAQANPPAKYRFYRGQESLYNTTTDSNVAVYTTLISERINQVKFGCTPYNGYGDGPTEIINVTVQYHPEIDSAPSAQSVIEGNGATLFCNATGNPPPSITWTTQGSDSVLFTSETLPLPNLMRGDNGAVYICKVQNNLGSAEANATITVFYEPSVTIQQCSTTVTEGDNATLECSATGNPVPSTAWIRASTGEVVSYNTKLVIAAIERSKSSRYECVAWNGIRNNSTKSCSIDVHYPPSASTVAAVPSNTTVLRGSFVSLVCSTDANPAANVYVFWFRRTKIGISSSGVFNVTVQADGVYTCFAINAMGMQQTTISITAVVPSSVEISKPTDTVVEGNNITLFCNASGKPEPTITWNRVGSSEVLSNTPSLTVVNVSRPGTHGNMIQYQCTASNGVGSPATAVATITVHYPPEITKPQTVRREVKTGESANIECSANGNPSPRYVWTNAAGEVVTTNRVLSLTKVDDGDGGSYNCTATNYLKSASFAILVRVTRIEISLELTIEKQNGLDAVYLPEYADLNSAPAKALLEEFAKEVDKEYANDSTYDKAEVTGLREGSVVVSFALYFTTSVTTNEGLAKLRNAVNNGSIGSFTVGTLKIIQQVVSTNPPIYVSKRTAVTEVATPGKKTLPTISASKKSKPVKSGEKAVTTSDDSKGIIIGCSVGGAVLIVAIVVVIIICKWRY